jgi:hypothetical protein
MGHSNGEDVNSIYTHIEIGLLREAIQKLERWAAAERKAAKEKTEKEKEDAKDQTTNESSNDPEEIKPHRNRGLSLITREQCSTQSSVEPHSCRTPRKTAR